MVKKLLKLFFIGLLLASILLILFLEYVTAPTSDKMRNNDLDGLSLEVNLSDADNRKAIIRTFYLEDYESKSDVKKSKIREMTAGRIEGDIPCLQIFEDNKLYIKFKKDDLYVEPDKISKVELATWPEYYGEDIGKKVIDTSLEEIKNKEYTLDIGANTNKNTELYLDYHYIKIFYSI